MTRGILTALTVTVLTAGASAQFSGWAEVVGQGGAAYVQLNLFERAGTGVEFADDCIIQEVRSGSQQGVGIWEAVWCNDVVIPINPYGSIVATWNMRDAQGTRVPDGHYFLKIRSRPVGSLELSEQWFGVTLNQRGNLPSLVHNPQINPGVPSTLAISSPPFAGGAYFAAASLSTNSGFDMFGGYLHAALDMDQIFAASVMTPNSGPFMLFQGNLDATGNAGFNFMVPTGLPPSLRHLNIHVQALLVAEPGGRPLPPTLTNVASGVLFLPIP